MRYAIARCTAVLNPWRHFVEAIVLDLLLPGLFRADGTVAEGVNVATSCSTLDDHDHIGLGFRV